MIHRLGRSPGGGKGYPLQYSGLENSVDYTGEKKRHTHLNAKFERIARRDKKAFLSDQCKKIEKNDKIRKTRSLQKIRDTKGTFHTKMG